MMRPTFLAYQEYIHILENNISQNHDDFRFHQLCNSLLEKKIGSRFSEISTKFFQHPAISIFFSLFQNTGDISSVNLFGNRSFLRFFEDFRSEFLNQHSCRRE